MMKEKYVIKKRRKFLFVINLGKVLRLKFKLTFLYLYE